LKKSDDKQKKEDKPKVRIDDRKKEQQKREEEAANQQGDDFKVVGKAGKVIDINPEQVPKKLREIAESRGKKASFFFPSSWPNVRFPRFANDG
jgi:hypothetical protein